MNIGDVLVFLQDNYPPAIGKYALVLKRTKTGRPVALQVPLENGDHEFIKLPTNADYLSTEEVYNTLVSQLPKQRKMRPGGGKNKGSGFEREMCEKISLWLSKGERKDLMCRTVGSGGQFTAARSRGQEAGLAGDIRSQDPIANELCNNFVIECKFWKDLDILNFLQREGLLYEALTKVQGEGVTTGKSWWLIAKQNRRPALLFTDRRNWQVNGVQDQENIRNLRYHSIFNGQVRMYNIEEFFALVQPEWYLAGVQERE